MSSRHKTSHIELLPEHLIDQIKAGEVVERPAALLKELLENSIDAGAGQINIHLVDNGLELISIEDNGHGMTRQDLPLAFARHATSKITRFEQIYDLNSFGFRGEALASIAAISRLTCSSTPTQENGEGGKIVIHGGEQKSLSPWQSKTPGTTIVAKDLFYNTPARLKFIKSKKSEKNALKRIINSFILANPTITFTVKWDERDKEFYPAITAPTPKTMQKRVQEVFFGHKKSLSSEEKKLHYFEGQYDGHSLKGFVSDASTKGHTGKSHYLFANRRLFIDKALHQIIIKNSQEIWGEMATGHYFVMINAPYDQIDVNIHPNKTQIKFLKSGVIYSMLSNTLKNLVKALAPKSIQSSSPTQTQKVSPPRSFPTVGNQNYGNIYVEKEENFLESSYDLPGVFQILHKGGQHHLVNNAIVFWLFWKKIVDESPLRQDKVSPLLISEPLPGKHYPSETINVLTEIGLEIEKIERDYFALRSVPECIHHLSIEKFILPFITKCLEWESKNLQSASQSIQGQIHQLQTSRNENQKDSTFYISPLETEVLLKELPMSVLVEQHALKNIASHDLSFIMERELGREHER